MSGGENSIVTLYFATQESDRGKGKSEALLLSILLPKKVIAGKERVKDGVVLLVSVLVAAQSLVVAKMLWCCVG